jgi:hypothetical protein
VGTKLTIRTAGKPRLKGKKKASIVTIGSLRKKVVIPAGGTRTLKIKASKALIAHLRSKKRFKIAVTATPGDKSRAITRKKTVTLKRR